MEEEFSNSVESGLKLAKRIYTGEERYAAAPPMSAAGMDRAPPPRPSYMPTAPMVYAVISDPAIVDNPDVPSYQPHVHGRCDPPALIPLVMNEMAMDVDCGLDSVFVSVRGSWRVHCVKGNKSCNCRLVVPMGEPGSILGVEVDVPRRSYSTEIVRLDETESTGKATKLEKGGFLKPEMFAITIPSVDGGCNLSIKVNWCKQSLFRHGQFIVSVPFNFPEYVNPHGKRFPSKEKIQLFVNTGIGNEMECNSCSHPLKERKRNSGKYGFLYEADVLTWSISDFSFSFKVSADEIFGGFLVQSPSVDDSDQRERFFLYLFPGKNKQVSRKEMIFLVDTSGSMKGRAIENIRNALKAAIVELNSQDSFGIIAFNDETKLFSSSMEPGTNEMIEKATQWIDECCVASGGTDMLSPINEAMKLSSSHDSAYIFLITDGSVEDERKICNMMRTYLQSRGSKCPRISTFGIGSYCNHYFLRMLAMIGRGHYDASYDADSIYPKILQLFTTATSSILANITIETFGDLDDFEVYPFPIPDLSSECPLMISGRYLGNSPDSLKAKGILPDNSSVTIDMKVEKAKNISLDKVFARRWIALLTAQAWLSESKELEEKVIKTSMEVGVTSEYTRMVLLQTGKLKPVFETAAAQEAKKHSAHQDSEPRVGRVATLHGLSIGFGDAHATAENTTTGFGGESVPKDRVYKKAVRCCNTFGACCCCPCCIDSCSHTNDQCAIVLAQLCTAFSCFGCLSCIDLCCPDE